MEKQYTENDLNKFFNYWKQISGGYGMEKVHQIINNPDAKAKWKGKSFFKPLNIILMTTIVITLITAISMWLSPIQTLPKQSMVKNETPEVSESQSTEAAQSFIPIGKISLPARSYKNQEVSNTSEPALKSASTGYSIQNVESKEVFSLKPQKPANCVWPKDTLLDKRKLFVILTKDEQERIGLFYRVDSTKIPQMEKFSRLYSNGIHMSLGPNHVGGSFSIYGYRKDFRYIRAYNAMHISNQLCSNKRWNAPFYNEIDTLVPVIVNDDIYWFLAISAVLDSLPYRYNYLKDAYSNLKCLKKQFPEKQLVNYWNKNMILGDIKFMELSKEELANIGVVFDSSKLGYRVEDAYTHKSYYTYRKEGDITNSTTSRDLVFPPSLPIIRTDEKGLNQWFFCRANRNNAFQVDLFVPIKIPLNEYVNGIDYYEIYWYNPTDSFINLLPERIRYQLKAEKEGILKISPQLASTCAFFEACKSTLQLDDLHVFPNPARDQLTVEFSAKEDLEGNITITNMAGVQIRQIMGKTNIKAGPNSFSVDLSGLPSGLFIISINTNKGFKTKRIIISQ
jgi:hypothetical protein